MKELSIEEKAKRYDEAIERAKEMIKAMTNIGGVAKVDDIQYLFPELAESDDERIRKWIIVYLENRVMNTSITDEKDNCLDAIRWLEKQGEQKPAEWSKEDKKVINLLLELVYEQDKMSPRIPSNEKRKMMLSWLKSLKPQPKHAEWSEEDEAKINRIVACLENLNVADNDILLKDVSWLKSLRPQNRWKPSEEQLKSLKGVIDVGYFTSYPNSLEILYEQLKKLREE